MLQREKDINLPLRAQIHKIFEGADSPHPSDPGQGQLIRKCSNDRNDIIDLLSSYGVTCAAGANVSNALPSISGLQITLKQQQLSPTR
mmetsp:Transcript_20737/g.37123  ORF Transcript_20737/g.37123 Transcript_20737/m.37123 type:complete len:88 (+) Transcript_20737:55-318(+)